MTPTPGWRAVLPLRFHDTDGQQMGLEVFTTEQAAQILLFAQANQDADELVVHCSMGHSRSAAVAIFLSEKFNVPCLKEQRQVNWESWPGYNRLVYRTLRITDMGSDIAEHDTSAGSDASTLDT